LDGDFPALTKQAVHSVLKASSRVSHSFDSRPPIDEEKQQGIMDRHKMRLVQPKL